MIRINLLPFRAARKRENIRRQVSVFFLCLVFLLAVMLHLSITMGSELSSLKAKENSLKDEYQSYAKINQEIAQIRKRAKELQEKLEVIHELDKKRIRPVQMLEQIALAIPIDRLWLRSISEVDGNLTLQGTAMDNDTVALFMTNLEKARNIHSVDLKQTVRQAFPDHNLTASGFVITCKATFEQGAKPQEPAQPDEGKKPAGRKP